MSQTEWIVIAPFQYDSVYLLSDARSVGFRLNLCQGFGQIIAPGISNQIIRVYPTSFCSNAPLRAWRAAQKLHHTRQQTLMHFVDFFSFGRRFV
jgi:hypothetical protein